MPKGKPYSGTIDSRTAVQLLNSSGELFEGVPLGDALLAISGKLETLVSRVGHFLRTDDFAQLVADYHAMKLGRRGRSDLKVTPTGQIILEIGYEEVPPRPLVKRTRRRLPLLKDLRAEAANLGVSIVHLGIKRKEIMDYLDKVKSERKGKEARPRAVAVEDDPGPMAAGPDETKVLPVPEEPRPPRRTGFMKTGEAVAASVVVDGAEQPPSRRSLREMVDQSREVNIQELLETKTPD